MGFWRPWSQTPSCSGVCVWKPQQQAVIWKTGLYRNDSSTQMICWTPVWVEKSYWGPEFIYFFIKLFFFLDALLTFYSNVTTFPSHHLLLMTRSETAVADPHTFNLAQIEPQRATFTSRTGPLVKFAENVSRHAAGVVGHTVQQTEDGWTIDLTGEHHKTVFNMNSFF